MAWTDPRFEADRRRYPPLVQYLMYTDVMLPHLEIPPGTVAEVDGQLALLKDALGLVRQAIAAVGDAALADELSSHVWSLKRRHLPPSA